MSRKYGCFNRWKALSAVAGVAVLIAAVPLQSAMADKWKHRGWVGAYYAPGAVYYAPPPPVVYYAPQPVYVAPQPVYLAPPPPMVYEVPPPAPVYYGPPSLNFGINIPLR